MTLDHAVEAKKCWQMFDNKCFVSGCVQIGILVRLFHFLGF